MCQQIIQLCSGSTRPLVFAGSFLLLILAIGLSYLDCRANALFQDIEPQLVQARSLDYHLQLAASAYLILIAVFACFAAHYDEKHSTRALAALTSVNFLLAVAAILLVPSGNSTQLADQLEGRLTGAIKLYNFTQKPEPQPAPVLSSVETLAQAAQANGSAGATSGAPTGDATKSKQKRMADAQTVAAPVAATAAPATPPEPLNATTATKLWDELQQRGCCGFTNATIDWKDKLPKSCCLKPDSKDGEYFCAALDDQHKLPCLQLIESYATSTKNLSLLLVLALIALVNLYLANVSGISAYRTFNYDEASQNAYT